MARTSKEAFTQDFAQRSTILGAGDPNTDPNLLIRSTSAPPDAHQGAVNLADAAVGGSARGAPTTVSQVDFLGGVDRSGARSVTGGGRGLGESAAAAAAGGGDAAPPPRQHVGQALAVAQQRQQQEPHGRDHQAQQQPQQHQHHQHQQHHHQHQQFSSYGMAGTAYQGGSAAASMYQYVPSPAMHPVNLGMMGMTHPPSPGLFPAQFVHASPSPYLGPASLSPYLSTPQMQAAPSASARFDFYPRQQHQQHGEDGVPSAPSPGPSPFLHPLLPQSLLGTPPTSSMQMHQFQQQQELQQMAAKQNSAFANGHGQQANPTLGHNAQYQQQAMPPPFVMPTLQLNQDSGSGPYAPHKQGMQQEDDSHQQAFHQHQQHLQQQQQQQQQMPMMQYSPGFGPSGYAMYAYAQQAPPQAQYYAAQGYVQTSPGMMPAEMMSPTLAMPSIAQLPPSASQTSPARQSSARYLSSSSASASSAAPAASQTGDRSSAGPAASGKERKPASKLVVDTSGVGGVRPGSAGGSGKPPGNGAAANAGPSPSAESGTTGNLLEKLHSRCGVSPRNGGGGRGRDGPGGRGQAGGRGGAAAAGSKRDKKSTPTVADVEWGLRSIRGQVVEFAKDQHGSRFLQLQLDSPTVSDEDKENLVTEILPHAQRLCADVFGNYTIQKLLTHGASTPAQQEQLVKVAIEGHMVDHSNGSYSCRVIQKMIECIFSEQGEEVARSLAPGAPGSTLYSAEYQDKLLHELDGHVISCACSNNANHVLQKLLECVRPLSRIDFIFDAFKGNMVQLSTQSYACRVAQRAMENAEDDRLEPLLAEIMNNVEVLIQDSFGNYVTQHIIQHGDPGSPESCLSRHRADLISIVKSNLLRFSQHKFSSNVVERCLESGNREERRMLITKMLEADRSSGKSTSAPRQAPPGSGAAGGSQPQAAANNGSGGAVRTLLEVMMTDQFANYVIQKALEVAEPDQREQIVIIIQRNASTLKRLTYGRHILNRLELNNKSGGSRRGRRSNNTGRGHGGGGHGGDGGRAAHE